VILLEFGFELFEQREGVGCRAGKACEDLRCTVCGPFSVCFITVERPLLAVACDRGLAVASHCQDRRAVKLGISS
jgi:hypothetical protein